MRRPTSSSLARRAIAIGASTGGVEALAKVISGFPRDCPPTLVVQHMPARFCSGFADRLNRLCAPSVEIAKDGMALKPGTVLIAPGGPHHLTIRLDPVLSCCFVRAPKKSGHRPSVDELFGSFALLGRRAAGVILTGMGRDGAEGLLKMRLGGSLTIGQDEASSVVYGMPRAAMECGAVEKQLPLHQISTELLNYFQTEQKDHKQ